MESATFTEGVQTLAVSSDRRFYGLGNLGLALSGQPSQVEAARDGGQPYQASSEGRRSRPRRGTVTTMTSKLPVPGEMSLSQQITSLESQLTTEKQKNLALLKTDGALQLENTTLKEANATLRQRLAAADARLQTEQAYVKSYMHNVQKQMEDLVEEKNLYLNQVANDAPLTALGAALQQQQQQQQQQ